MQISLTLIDKDGIIKKLELMPTALDEAVRLGVQKVAEEFKREIVGKQGLTMFGRHSAGTPTPSSPGQPPAQITTFLRQSVQVNPARRTGFATYTSRVMPHAEYALTQEVGDPSRGIPARPFVSPARDRMNREKRAERIFQARMKQFLKHGR